MPKKGHIRSPIKQQLLFLLGAGTALALTRSPRTQTYIIKNIPRVLREINRDYLRRIISEFKRERLVDYVEDQTGVIRMVLTDAGKLRVLQANIDNFSIKKKPWNGSSLIVFFDVPERKRKLRDSFRYKLKELGFIEIQKSVFIHPFADFDEIDFLIEFYDARRYVRRGYISELDNEAEIRLHFGIY